MASGLNQKGRLKLIIDQSKYFPISVVFIDDARSEKDLGVGLRQMHDHLPKEGIRPGEPIPGDLGGVIHREGLMHEAILGGLDETSQTVTDLVVRPGGEDLDGQCQRPDVPLVGVRTAHSVDLPPSVEVLVLLGEDESAGVAVDDVVLVHEAQVGQTQQAGQVGVIVEPVTAQSVHLVGKNLHPALLNHPVLVYAATDTIRVDQHTL